MASTGTQFPTSTTSPITPASSIYVANATTPRTDSALNYDSPTSQSVVTAVNATIQDAHPVIASPALTGAPSSSAVLQPVLPLEYSSWLICRGFQRNVIDAEIAVGQHAGKRVFLPRIPLYPSENDMYPFKLKTKQFPIRLSFAMTINKAQGQTVPHVGVYLPESVFSHGQLYVALSRGISRERVKVLVRPTQIFHQPGVYTAAYIRFQGFMPISALPPSTI